MRNTVLACMLASACAAFGQTPSEFEVASVKQLEKSIEPGQTDLSFVGAGGKIAKITGNRVTLTGTLHTILTVAYGVKGYQIAGEPPWAGSLVYAIAAKTAGDAEPTQELIQPMLQALLADRFQLKIHRESKELPVYHLTQAKKTGKFTPAAPGETFSWNLTPAGQGTLRSKATKESIGDFVQLVTVSTDRPVIDKTGIGGYIDYDILISPLDARNQDDINHAIIDAVKEQLGLKLEPTKERIDMVVVDAVSKPSEN